MSHHCVLCGQASSAETLREAAWLDDRVIARISLEHPRWRRSDGACPACVQEAVLERLIIDGRDALEGHVQRVWPIDAEAAFGALPTPLRLRADPRFTGRTTTMALVDAAFYPHPDLVRPENRIRAWVDATSDAPSVCWFSPDDVPVWPTDGTSVGHVWHGLMTSVSAAGNGWLSHGLYRGLASEAQVVLVQVARDGRITSEAIARALEWLHRNSDRLQLSVVSLSVSGDEPIESPDPIEMAIDALVSSGVVVVAAAGNDGIRHLLPPATARNAITVGGLDDRHVLSRETWELWHSNYGVTRDRTAKPEVVAPSLWCVAPILPGSEIAVEARQLFDARAHDRSPAIATRIGELRLVTPYYQHVEGTSFAAPVVASVIACMRDANPHLAPQQLKSLLMGSAVRVPGAADARQGAGAVDAGLAVAAALAARQTGSVRTAPAIEAGAVRFELTDRAASSVEIVGSWNEWQSPLPAVKAGDIWRATISLPPGQYDYKFLIDSHAWLPDPANPLRTVTDDGHVNSAFVLRASDF